MHEKMKIKHVLNNSNLLSKIVRKYKSKTKLFVNKSEMFYFRFFRTIRKDSSKECMKLERAVGKIVKLVSF